MVAIRRVLPSGDLSGESDRVAIQAAIQAVTLPVSSRGQGLVILVADDRPYYVDRGLVIGDLNDHNGVKSCNIVGVPQALVRYVGPVSSTPLLTVTGNTYSPTPRVSGLYLDCASQCRGIHWRQTYMASIENTMIFNAREVALDVNSSWKSVLRDVHIWYTGGIAMRVWKSMGFVADNMRIANTGNQVPLVWPAEDDESVVAYDGTLIRTPAAERGAMWIYSREMTFRNLMWERNRMGDLPLCFVRADYSQGIHFTELNYLELNETNDCYWRLRGSPNPAAFGGADFLVENVPRGDKHATPCLVRTSGHIDHLRVDGIRQVTSGHLLQNVIQCDGAGSKLYRASVTGSRCGVPRAAQIVGVNGGSIESGHPFNNHYQDVEDVGEVAT